MATCDCELYEVCPVCAPTQGYYDKAAEAVAAAIPVSPQMYSLNDIREITREYANEHEGPARLSLQIMTDKLVAWMAKREQGKEG